MKKFISMVMAAAMVVSLVPATAFAASGTAEFNCVNAIEVKEENATSLKTSISGPQGQIILKDVKGDVGATDAFEVTIDLDNAEFVNDFAADSPWWGADVMRAQQDTKYVSIIGGPVTASNNYVYMKDGVEKGDTSVVLVIEENAVDFKAGDIVVLPIPAGIIKATTIAEGTVISGTFSGDFGESEPVVFASILAPALDVNVAGKPVETAAEVNCELKDITVKSKVNNFKYEEVKVKVSKGWEVVSYGTFTDGATFKAGSLEDDEFIVVAGTSKTFKIQDMVVEAVSADAGDVCVVTVTTKGWAADSDEAAKVIAETVVMSVDENEDVPVMYAGLNTTEEGLQTTADHKALTVTIEETVAKAWDNVESWTLTLPEGVYAVAGTTVTGNGTFSSWKGATGPVEAFENAYEKGDYEAFEFGRRAFTRLNDTTKLKITLDLVLVAEPGFTGDVVLTLEGEDISENAQEVVIAKFVAPYTVEAASNDLVIDYRNTKVDTDIVIKEAEMTLWDDSIGNKAAFAFTVDKANMMTFEDDATVVVDEESDMTIKTKVVAGLSGNVGFSVDEESDETAAAVTISDIELFMNRSLPAGAYDLTMQSTLFNFVGETVFGAGKTVNEAIYDKAATANYVETVKEGWVNVITAGRDKDDASFTTKVVVPVGESYLVAGEETVALDVPAYINANGYTMLPVRAVAVALGIHNNNVIWSQAAKQVTILYGQRIITMTVGESVIYVNGSAIPASAAVEVVDGRAFLGLRDLANALGVVEINWDAATSTATLN